MPTTAHAGPMSSRDALLENLPNVADIEGKEVSIEINAPDRADINVLFDPPKLRNKAEEGLAKKNIREKMQEKDTDGGYVILNKIQKEFEEKKDGLVLELAAGRSLDDWREANENALAKLQQLRQAVREQDVNSMQELRGQLSLGRLGGNSDVGEEASRSLAKFVDALTSQKQKTQEEAEEVANAIKAVIKQQIGVDQVISLVNQATSYDTLTPEAQSHVFRLYLNKRWEEELGTATRNEMLARLCWRQNAPSMVMPGWERDVYQALYDVEALKEQLATTDDPAKRAEIEADIKRVIKSVEMGVSALTHKDRAFWPGVTGEEQVKHGAWAEIKEVIDRLRESTDPEGKKRDGRPKNTFVMATATYDQASWESIGLKTEIFFHFGIATNALKHIESLGNTGEEQFNEFVSRGFFKDLENKDVYKDKPKQNKRRDELKKAEEEYGEVERRFKELKTKHDELKRSDDVRNAPSVIASANQEITELTALLNGTDINEAPAATPGTPATPATPPERTPHRSRDRDDSDTLRKALKAAQDRRRLAQAAQDKYDALDREFSGVNNSFNGNTAAEAGSPDRQSLAERLHLKELRKQVAENELDQEDAAAFTAQKSEATKKRFNDLVDKLKKYLAQRQYDVAHDYNQRFTKEERTIIARLNGMAADGDGNAIQELVSHCETEDGFVGDYAFINGWALGEQVGRASPDQIERILKSDRDPEVKDLIQRAKDKGKIIIVTSFGVEHDVDGRIIGRVATGSGPEFNFDRAEEFKLAHGWTDLELFEHWLDDLNLQRALGVRPEEIDEKYIANIARNHQFRKQFFSGADGWTFINTNVASSTGTFFETTIRRMVDAEVELTGHGLRKAPFYRQLGRSNEYAITITDDNMNREVRYRGEKLNNSVEAPKTVVARLYRSLMNELELYYKRTQIGGQATSAADHMTKDDIDQLGSLVLANMELIRKKMIKLRTIADHPSHSNDERLQMMLDFRDTEMLNLTHDIIDENGEFLEESSNPELWEEFNATGQWLGKLKRNLRESTWRYATTEANPNVTDEELEIADADYEYHLNERRNFEVKIRALGMQAAGRMRDMDNRQISEVFSKTHAKITGEELRRLQEEQMRARFMLDDDQEKWGNTLARRLVGKIAKNRIMDLGRSIGRHFGIGDRYLKEVDAEVLSMDVRRKMDNRIFDRAAAHYAHAIQTGYQNSWGGILSPGRSNLIIPGATGVQMSRTGEDALDKLVNQRVKDDIDDAVDRTIKMNMHKMIKVGKDRGWNVDELMKVYLDARMNDTQEVVYENGQWQTDNYGKADWDDPRLRGKGTRISQLERVFRSKVRTRLERSGWTQGINMGNIMPKASPDETRAVPDRYSRPSTTAQRTRHNRAAVDVNGNNIAQAGAY